MNSQQHQKAAEELLRQVPHDVGVLEEREDLGAVQIAALLAVAHAVLASADNVTQIGAGD